EKTLEDYYARLEQNEIPVFKGHLLTEEDLKIRKHILNLMCHFETNWQGDMDFAQRPQVLEDLAEMQNDQLVKMSEYGLKVTEAGKPFVRNICMAFDLRLKRNKPENRIFSMTI